MNEEILVPVPGDRIEVERLAYKLWELSGKTHGNDVIHWVLAELVLTQYVRIGPQTKRAAKNSKAHLASLKAMVAD